MMPEGPQLAGYVWERWVGSGGSAEVHRYRQQTPARTVAVKVPRDRRDATATTALHREADAMAVVAGHPAALSLFSLETGAEGSPALVMEFCPANLADRLRQGPLVVAEVLPLMVRIAGAAATFHRCGWVHRDIKPANLMVTSFGSPVLADFGASRRAGEGATYTAEFSVLYAPPEQQQAGPATPALDVWGLGATTWALLVGQSPFAGGSLVDREGIAARVREGRLPDLNLPDAPESLMELLASALMVDPRQRLDSALAFAEGLRRVEADLGLPLTGVAVPELPMAGSGVPPQPGSSEVTPELQDTVTPADESLEVTIKRPHVGVELAVTTAEEAPDVPSTRRPGVAPGLVVVLVLLALVVGGALVSGQLRGALSSSTGEPSEAALTQEPVTLPPEPVSEVTGAIRNGRAWWSWRASTTPKVRYQVTLTRPDEPDVVRMLNLASFDHVAVPGEQCLAVVAVSTEGRPSTVATGCVSA
ncbi:MAG: serine/threonine-protein kinase [Propioniciclava sp.]